MQSKKVQQMKTPAWASQKQFPADLSRAGQWEIAVSDSLIPLPFPAPVIQIVEHESYFTLKIEIPANNDLADALRTAILHAAEDHQMLPISFMAKQDIADLLTPTLKELGISCAVVTKLPAIQSMQRAMKQLAPRMLLTMKNHTSKNTTRRKENITPPQKNDIVREQPTGVLQFKITLNNVKPAVWRRIRVPADFSFGELSLATMDAFGHTPGYHLHGWSIQPFGAKTRDFIRIGPPDPEEEGFGDQCDERREMIADYFGKSIKQSVFTYDYGDNWEHTALFEGAFPVEISVTYPQLLTGKNATPPPDCGGPWGYEDLLKALKDPKNPEHKNMMEWLGLERPEDLDPTEFDPADISFGTRKEYQRFLKNYDGMIS